MKKNLQYITILLCMLFSTNGIAQTDTEFWFVVPEIWRDHNDRPIRFVFTTTDFPADITMEMPANGAFTPITLSLPANTTDWLEYSSDADLNMFENRGIVDEIFMGGDNISNKGILITSTAPITCYYEVNTTNNSDIWSLKGSNGLGKDFYIPFQDIGQNRHRDYGTRNERGFSSIEIIGTGGTTVVEIYPSNNVYKDGVDTDYDPALGMYTITLEKGEVYTLAPAWDPTIPHGSLVGWWGVYRDQHIGGTYISVQSGDDIAVIVKDDSVTEDIGESTLNPGGGWDIIADQWVPEHILGTEYVAMRGTLASDEEKIFAVATEDNTRIWWDYGGIDTTVAAVNAAVNAVIDKGEQVRIDFPSTQAYKYIISNKKLSVLHVSGVGTEMGGAVLPPIDKCTGSTNVGFTRSKGDPAKFHMNIMVRTTARNGFLVNGAPPTFFDGSDLYFTDIPGTPWSVARITDLTDADVPPDVTTTISNTMDVFHLGVINETDGGAGCRFGYFSDFNEVEVSALSLQDGAQPTSTPRVCIGDSIQLYSSKAISYEWWPSDDLSSTTIFNPKALVTGYKVYSVKVSGYCNQSDTASVSITPLTQPDANFMLSSPSGCAPLDIDIRNQSKNVSRMYWDFNGTLIDGMYDQDTTIYKKISGNDSTVLELDTTFFHSFNNTSFEPIDSPQVYEVKLIVKNTKCYDSLSTNITVYPEVTADFTLSDLNDTLSCNPAVVDFEAVDSSINEDYYKWSFGDGALSSTGDTTHEYVNVDPENDVLYTAQLIARSQWNCRDTAYQDFLVHPYLEGGFTIDEDEGCSPLTVKIDNISTGADSIFLDYGDGTMDTLLTFNTIYHEYRNNDGVDEVDTNIIVMRVKNDEGCEFIDRDTIVVYPEFEANYIIDGPGDYEGCNSRLVEFTNTTNDGTHIASRYLWEFADGTSMDTTNATVDKFYDNTTSTTKTYNFRLTARSQYGCTDDTTNTITIYRAEANFTVDNNEGCSPLPVQVTNISVGDQINSWKWDYYGDGSVVNTTEYQPLAAYTYTNNGIVNDTNNLVLTVTEANGCSSTDTAKIVVYPGVQISYVETVIADPAACDSLAVDFNSTKSSAVPVTYEWNFGDGGSSSAADTVHVYRNLLSSTQLPMSVSLRAETDMGCFDEASSVITVNPRVKAKIFVDKSSDCSPLTVDVDAQEYPGNSTYSWDYDDGSGTFNGHSQPPHPYPANQSYAPQPGGDNNYELILDVDGPGGCTDSDTVDITVYSEIVADFTANPWDGCNPLTIDFTDNSSANADAWSWDFADGSTSSTEDTQNTFTNLNPGQQFFMVSLDVTSDRGCTDHIEKQITVEPYVEADFDIDISESCSPFSVTITNNSSGTEYYWFWNDNDLTLGNADSNSDAATISAPYSLTTGGSRTDNLTLIVGNGQGCYDTLKRAITVYSSINAGYSYTQNDACAPSDVVFTNTSTGSGTYTMNWDFDDGGTLTTTANTVNKQFINNTTDEKTFNVVMTAESANGCTDTYSDNIIVHSKVVSDFSIANNEGCPPFATSIENTSIGNAANTYQWLIDGVDAGGPTNKSNFDHIYENTDPSIKDYEVKLIATNPHGCTDEHTDIVSVYEYVEAIFKMSTNNGCAPLLVEFEDSSIVPAETKYTWTFGDGATSGLSDPNHTFYNSSRKDDLNRTINLTVQSANYCSDDTSLSVDIYHQPLAKFYINNSSSCPPLESTLTKLSEGEDSFEWRFGDGNTNTTDVDLAYSWDNNDIDNIQYYNLELWVGTNNNCVDSTSLDVTVFPKVIADFTITDILGNPVTGGCSPLDSVHFTNTSTLPATQFFWSFGDGTTTNQEDPSHDFTNITSEDRIYDIYFRASSEYNCWDTITKQVEVFVQPEAEFYVTPVLLTYPNNAISLDNRTNTGPFDYLWRFGNIDESTSTSEEPNSYEYGHWGEKIIELEVTSQTNPDCIDSYSDIILIQPPEVNADFTTNIDGGCWDGGLEVEFTAASSAYAEEYDYEWDFGDGTTGTGQNTIHVFESVGTYNVQLTAKSTEGAGRDYAYKKIYVYANPEVSFEVSPKLAMLDPSTLKARVKFYNTSLCNDTAGCAYTWDFGDGNTAISKDYTHAYEELGIYDITLTAESANGCRDSLTLYEEVEIIGAGEIAFPNAFTPDGIGPTENETFKPLAEGVIKYELLIYNRWGELIFTTKDLGVGWDGTIDGEPAKPDVYVWKASGEFTNGKSFELAGDVTLIR